MKKGFTLIEIMVVIAIVIVLLTLALPNIFRSRVTANECLTIANLQVLNRACQGYHIDQGSYPDNLSDLSTASPSYIDSVLGSGNKQGYEFVYASPTDDSFTVHANPTHTGLLKGRYFYLDESGTIRVRSNQEAGPNDPAIE